MLEHVKQPERKYKVLKLMGDVPPVAPVKVLMRNGVRFEAVETDRGDGNPNDLGEYIKKLERENGTA